MWGLLAHLVRMHPPGAGHDLGVPGLAAAHARLTRLRDAQRRHCARKSVMGRTSEAMHTQGHGRIPCLSSTVGWPCSEGRAQCKNYYCFNRWESNAAPCSPGDNYMQVTACWQCKHEHMPPCETAHPLPAAAAAGARLRWRWSVRVAERRAGVACTLLDSTSMPAGLHRSTTSSSSRRHLGSRGRSCAGCW